MDCPLTTIRDRATFAFRIGAERARKSSQSNLSRSTNHTGAFTMSRHAKTGFNIMLGVWGVKQEVTPFGQSDRYSRQLSQRGNGCEALSRGSTNTTKIPEERGFRASSRTTCTTRARSARARGRRTLPC